MALTKEERQKIDETHDRVLKLSTVLLGTRGDNGLIGDFRRVAQSHFNLKRNFWILVGTLAGAGVLGSGLWGFLLGG